MSASRFANRVVLVTGGSGTVGSGIVRQFLSENAKVIAPVRSEKGAASLKETVSAETLSNLDIFTVDVTDEAEATSFAKQVKEKYGSIDHVVSSIGSWWQKGELTEQLAAEFRSQSETYAVSHFLVFKNFVPLLADDASSSYTFITGTAGEMYIPGASLVTVGQGALYGVSIVARGQFANKAPRVNEFRIGATITRDADARPAAGSYSHFQIGKKVADLAASSTKGEIVKCLPNDLK